MLLAFLKIGEKSELAAPAQPLNLTEEFHLQLVVGRHVRGSLSGERDEVIGGESEHRSQADERLFRHGGNRILLLDHHEEAR